MDIIISPTVEQQLNAQQLQSLNILQMNTAALEDYLIQLSQENPMIDLPDLEAIGKTVEEITKYSEKIKWIESLDYHNLPVIRTDDDEMEPMNLVGNAGGLEETLTTHLIAQIERICVSAEYKKLLRFLVMNLDDDGYFRMNLDQAAEETGFSRQDVENCLDMIKTMDPPGVGAKDLQECLLLQLQRMECDPLAEKAVSECLQDFAHNKLNSVSVKLGISKNQAEKILELIQSLEPRPGQVFSAKEDTVYVEPDVAVIKEGDTFTVHMVREKNSFFTVNTYYAKMLKKTEDTEVRRYLTEKMNQVNSVLFGLEQRESTIKRCAEVILRWQHSFFENSTNPLVPLSMTEVSAELGIHLSTVSRAVKDKYIVCNSGLYPMSHFFVRGIAGNGNTSISNERAKSMLMSIISQENKRKPLSDQKICELMVSQGCEVSRRTIAKYRQELNIPGISERRCE